MRRTELVKQFESKIAKEKNTGLLTLIRYMFALLSVLASALGHPHPMDLHAESAIAGQDTIFSSIAEARTALSAFMAHSHSFIKDATEWHECMFLSGDVQAVSVDTVVQHSSSEMGQVVLPRRFDIIKSHGVTRFYYVGVENHVNRLSELFGKDRLVFEPPTPFSVTGPLRDVGFNDLLSCKTQLQKKLGQWLDAFRGSGKHFESTEPETANCILMYYHVSLILLSTRLTPTQTVFDNYTHGFREIVRHAKTYLAAQAPQNSTFTFELGAVPALYFTATKCRIPSLRRRALDLISETPKKESMWGARSVAELVSRFIIIEEQGLGLPAVDCSGRCSAMAVDDAILLPEERRVTYLMGKRGRWGSEARPRVSFVIISLLLATLFLSRV